MAKSSAEWQRLARVNVTDINVDNHNDDERNGQRSSDYLKVTDRRV
jgi:hypothetical protein